MAAPALPEADPSSRLVWVPSAVAEDGSAAQALRLTLWPLRDATTGDRNLDALQDLPHLPADATRPLDGHARPDVPDGEPGLPRAWRVASPLDPTQAARHAEPVLDAAAALLPALSRRQLFGGAEVVLSETRVDLPTEAGPRVAWQAIEPRLNTAQQGLPGAGQGVEPAPDARGGLGEVSAALRRAARPHRAWLDGPAELLRTLRSAGGWLLLGLAVAVGLGYALKAYSRRI